MDLKTFECFCFDVGLFTPSVVFNFVDQNFLEEKNQNDKNLTDNLYEMKEIFDKIKVFHLMFSNLNLEMTTF